MAEHSRIWRGCVVLLLLSLVTGEVTSIFSMSRTCAAESTAKAPPLRVQVDPRVELMCILFRLAGNPEYNRGQVQAYTDDVEEQFGPFRDHAVVKLAQKLREKRGIGFDAPMNMAVHLPDLYSIQKETFLSPRPKDLDGRWTVDDAGNFLVAARQFVKDTSFREFVEKHRPLYELTQSRLQAVLGEQAHLEWFNEFFGERPGATFVAVPGLLNGPNNYGARRRTADGTEELFCILGVWYADKQGMPEFRQGMVDTVVHEFCHSYANAVIDRHSAELKAAGEKIFPHVAKKMRSQAYGNWKTMFYESLVRACVLRHTRHYDGAIAAWWAAQQEKARGFAWIEELSNLLGQYEEHRDQYPSLEAFSPRLIAFFDENAAKYASE